MLMIVDPCYVLKDKSPLAEKIASKPLDTDYEKAFVLSHQPGPQFRVADDKDATHRMVDEQGNATKVKLVRNTFDDAEPLTHEQHEQIAFGAVCGTARGDGTFPVYAVYVGDTLVSMEVRFDLD
jgi:hypothetical protein